MVLRPRLVEIGLRALWKYKGTPAPIPTIAEAEKQNMHTTSHQVHKDLDTPIEARPLTLGDKPVPEDGVRLGKHTHLPVISSPRGGLEN